MKAKLLFPLLLLLLNFGKLEAQEYHPLLNESSWILSHWVSCCIPSYNRTISVGTQQVIGGHTYTKFCDPFPGFDGNFNQIDTVYVREDVEARKVYKLVDGNDAVLYDFNMADGDAVDLEGITFLASVDDVSTNAGMRKRITLNSADLVNGHTLQQIWIEGVGSPAHPFYPDRNMYNVFSSGGGTVISTLCSFQGGNHIYGPSNCVTLGVAQQMAQQPQIRVYPNPFKSSVTISSEKAFKDAEIKLYTLQGRMVLDVNDINEQSVTINRGNLSAGLYIAHVFEQGSLVESRKIVVE